MKFIYSEVIPKLLKSPAGRPTRRSRKRPKIEHFANVVVLAVARTSRVVLSVKDNLKYYNSERLRVNYLRP